MTVLWTFRELAAIPGIRLTNVSGDEDTGITGVSIDSRTLEPGDLFIALSGTPRPPFHASVDQPRDGHTFISEAIRAGASAIMASKPVTQHVPLLAVQDTFDGLWALGTAARGRFRRPVVAVTGSSGKTTAKTWLQFLLAGFGTPYTSSGSLNNHWGVPLSLARMARNADFAVFEAGMNHPGELAPLSEIIQPDIALLLNVLPVHLGQFRDLDAIRHEKLAIARGLAAESPLIVPVELDTSGVASYNQRPRLVTFGFDPGAHVSGDLEMDANGATLRVTIRGQSGRFALSAPAEHLALTALACLAVIDCLGLDAFEAGQHLVNLPLPDGRGNRIAAGGVELIDDSYNANPESMRQALLQLRRISGGRRIAILGEMLELGATAPSLHRSVLAACCRGPGETLASVDGLFTAGEGFSAVLPGAAGSVHTGHLASVDDAALDQVAAFLMPGDTVLVKGSNKVFRARDFVNRLATRLRTGQGPVAH